MTSFDPELITQWLARETGNSGEPTDGEGRKPLGLKAKSREELRRFFDGLEAEKALTAKRRMDTAEAVNTVPSPAAQMPGGPLAPVA